MTGSAASSAPRLVLASASPRRARVLDILGLEHDVLPSTVPEEPRDGESTDTLVERLARDKARAVAAECPGALVLAGDTVVVRDGALLGKPEGPDEAEEMLLSLSGRTHTVVTGLALAGPGPGDLRSRHDAADVTFRTLDRATVAAYVETGEPLDKAGGYGIQGAGAALVSRVEGDYYTVVGLPVSGLLALLESGGWRYDFRGLSRRPGGG